MGGSHQNLKEEIKQHLGKKILSWYEHQERRVYFSISASDILEVVNYLFVELHFRFCTASGVDTPRGLEILYHFSHDAKGVIYSVRVLLEDKENPQISSITPIIRGAEWIEREIWELLGIKFINHPNLVHLILNDDWPEGKYPLRQKGYGS